MALRRGPEGALVASARKGEAWHVPAAPDTLVVDTTGKQPPWFSVVSAFFLGFSSMLAAEFLGCALAFPPDKLAWCRCRRLHALPRCGGLIAA